MQENKCSLRNEKQLLRHVFSVRKTLANHFLDEWEIPLQCLLWDYNVNVWMKTKKKRTRMGALPIAECVDGLRIRNACQHFRDFFHAFFKGF